MPPKAVHRPARFGSILQGKPEEAQFEKQDLKCLMNMNIDCDKEGETTPRLNIKEALILITKGTLI